MECLTEHLHPSDSVSFYSTCKELYVLSRQVYISTYYASKIVELVNLKNRSTLTVADPLRTYNRLYESLEIELHACYGNVDEVRVLLRSQYVKTNSIHMALYRACAMGHLEIVKLIARLGYIDANRSVHKYQSTFSRKANMRLPRYIQMPLPKHNNERSCIHAALANGHENIARLLGWRPPKPVVANVGYTSSVGKYLIYTICAVGVLCWTPIVVLVIYIMS